MVTANNSYVQGSDDPFEYFIALNSAEGSALNDIGAENIVWLFEDGHSALKVGTVVPYEPVTGLEYSGTYYKVKNNFASYVGNHRTAIRACSKYDKLIELYLRF